LKKLKAGIAAKHKNDSLLYSHDIKGSAKNIGAEEIGRIALIMEDASKLEEYDTIEKHMDELYNAFKLLKEVFKKYITQATAKT